MPRAEKRVIEYFVSTQNLQSILDLLHAAGKTERSELNVYAYAVLDSCSEQFYGGVRKHFAHAQTVYTRPFFWEGPGYEATITSEMLSIVGANPLAWPVSVE